MKLYFQTVSKFIVNGIILFLQLCTTFLFIDNFIYKGYRGRPHDLNNGVKIDCRVVFLIDKKEIDLADMEAARYMATQKINDDHLKLFIESKNILDFLVKNSSCFDPKTIEVYMVQICGRFFFLYRVSLPIKLVY